MKINSKEKTIYYKNEITEDYLNKGLSIKKIGEKYEIPHTMIHKMLKHWNIVRPKPQKSKLDKYKNEILNLYLIDKLTPLEISKLYNTTGTTVDAFLNKYLSREEKRDLSESHRKYDIDTNFFNTIDTEEKAYWLGFLYADGYITDTNIIGITLNINDKKHLEKFKESTKSNYIISENSSTNEFGTSHYCSIRFRNSIMFNDLINQGCIKNKSLILKFPKNIPNDLIRHFIRGYLDGDGSIGIDIERYHYRVRFVGTKEFLLGLSNFIEKEIDLEVPNFQKQKYETKNNYTIQYGGKNKVIKILDFIYENSNIYLDRKYEQYNIIKQLKIVEPNGNIGC